MGSRPNHEPCIRVRKDQLIRRDTNHGAELLGQRQEFGGPFAKSYSERDRKDRGAVGNRAGEPAQGVQKQVVEPSKSY